MGSLRPNYERKNYIPMAATDDKKQRPLFNIFERWSLDGSSSSSNRIAAEATIGQEIVKTNISRAHANGPTHSNNETTNRR